jgi:hypothetical protein
VIHFTDFSPNRKTPLERDIRVSNSREQIDVLWKDLMEENITKGWALAGDSAGAGKPIEEPKPAAEEKPTTKKRGKTKTEEIAAPPELKDAEPEPKKPSPRKKKGPG